MTNEDKIVFALQEAVDALGDIPDENTTNQQKHAYRLCVDQLAELHE